LIDEHHRPAQPIIGDVIFDVPSPWHKKHPDMIQYQ
jgi:hypothetical protein